MSFSFYSSVILGELWKWLSLWRFEKAWPEIPPTLPFPKGGEIIGGMKPKLG